MSYTTHTIIYMNCFILFEIYIFLNLYFGPDKKMRLFAIEVQ